MSDRRVQWLRFYEAALTGAVGPARGMASVSEGDAIVAAAAAARIADAAMARLDARDFPRSHVDPAQMAAAREALLWFADEGHYTDTYRLGEGYVDAHGLGVARRALGLKIDREDGTLMPLAEALAALEEKP